MSEIDRLKKELHLKQLQINSLLTVTQAINDNVASDGLFSMYKSFLQFEMSISKMALFFKENGHWDCKTRLEVSDESLNQDSTRSFSQFKSTTGLAEYQHGFFKDFDVVIPVIHKTNAIAYVFIGGFKEEDDIVNKVQFITTITNIIAVAIENKRLFKQQMRQEVLNREVELAAEIQRTLVPSRLPSGNSYQLSSIYKPHFAVGGDYYDVVEFPGEKLTFCIADIAGKGLSAAMLMANFQATLHSLVHRALTLEEIVEEVNRAVFRVTKGDRHLTLFLAKYDSSNRTLHYVNAGHTPPYLLMNGETVRLQNGTTVLGFDDTLPFLEIGGVCLTSEALIFTYTDGLTDVKNPEEEDFGEENLLHFLEANVQYSAKEVNSRLLSKIEEYRQRTPLPDDITVLTCKIF